MINIDKFILTSDNKYKMDISYFSNMIIASFNPEPIFKKNLRPLKNTRIDVYVSGFSLDDNVYLGYYDRSGNWNKCCDIVVVRRKDSIDLTVTIVI
mgnify:CR=1 FL=1